MVKTNKFQIYTKWEEKFGKAGKQKKEPEINPAHSTNTIFVHG